jgi:DNA-binding transcriptional LysR family regulator
MMCCVIAFMGQLHKWHLPNATFWFLWYKPIREENEMLNFSGIRVFAVSAETGSFSKAAERLQVSQPAVSQQIRSLEESLCVQLFRRSSQGVALTSAGKVLLPMARELLTLSHHIQETMGSLEDQVSSM